MVAGAIKKLQKNFFRKDESPSPEEIQKRRIAKSGLFDPGYYLLQNPDIKVEGDALFDHFIYVGGPEGRRAHPLFDPEFYDSLYPDIRQARVNPLYHYLEYGYLEDRIPHPLFDAQYYLKQVAAGISDSITPLEHFFQIGSEKNLDPNPYFSTQFYRDEYGEILKGEDNPLIHYILYGAVQGCNPHPLFFTDYYIEANQDVAQTGINPLHHYLHRGLIEGRDANPLFDVSWYTETYAPTEGILKEGFQHYKTKGQKSGFNPSPALSTRAYLEVHRHVSPESSPIEDLLNRYRAALKSNPSDKFSPIRLWLRDLFALQSNKTREGDTISIVIPCYNQGYLIEDALLSAHLATTRPLDIIVIDDGSNDPSTEKKVSELAERYGAQLHRQQNRGLSSARNTGLERAAGKYIQFLDSDDLLVPQKIDKQLSEDSDMYISEYLFCDSYCGNWTAPFPSTIKGFDLSYDSFLRNWERGLTIPIHCGLFKRSLFENIRFDEELTAKEDWMMWLSLRRLNPKISFLDFPLVLYRQHGQNMGREGGKMAENYLKAAFKIIQQTKNNDFLNAVFEHFNDYYVELIKQDALKMSAKS